MPQQPLPAPPSNASALTPRVRLAHLSLEAARAVPGVLGADAGLTGLRVTADPRAGLLRGVSVTAQEDGRYTVDLSLAAGIVPLPVLGEEVRRSVRANATSDGLGDQLGTVNVEFTTVASGAPADEPRSEIRG